MIFLDKHQKKMESFNQHNLFGTDKCRVRIYYLGDEVIKTIESHQLKTSQDPCNHLPCTQCTILKGPGTKSSVGPVIDY